MKNYLIIIVLFIGLIAGNLLSPGRGSLHAQSKNKLLSVVITANGDSINIKGYYIYIKNGKEIRTDIEKDNAWGWNFRGDYIKEVDVQKTSGDASYSLFIMEDGKIIYESDFVKSSSHIIFKRNKTKNGKEKLN